MNDIKNKIGFSAIQLPVQGVPIKKIQQFFEIGYPHISQSINVGGQTNSYQYLFNQAVRLTNGNVKIYQGNSLGKIQYGSYSYNQVQNMFKHLQDENIDIKQLLTNQLYAQSVSFKNVEKIIAQNQIILVTKNDQQLQHYVKIQLPNAIKINTKYTITGELKCSISSSIDIFSRYSEIVSQSFSDIPYQIFDQVRYISQPYGSTYDTFDHNLFSNAQYEDIRGQILYKNYQINPKKYLYI